MINEIDLKKAIVSLLQSKYATPQYHYYGIAVTEGNKKPYFFTDLRLLTQQDETANIVSKKYFVAITYQPQKINEVDNFKKVEEIRELLCCIDDKKRKRKMTIKVKDRYIKVDNFSFTYTGEENNILQIQMDLSFLEFAVTRDTEPIMEEFEINQELKE